MEERDECTRKHIEIYRLTVERLEDYLYFF